jgi:NADH-quinone oxidoreductase subunit J
MIEVAAFYLFSAILLLSAVLVITARNPVHSVLFLVLAFFNAAGLFVLLGAEFIGMILVIVYVGAVAVLFLFVVMMLDINFADLRKGSMRFVSLGVLLGGVLLAELVVLYSAWANGAPDRAINLAVPIPDAAQVENTKALGHLLYTQYVFAFQIAGLILLVAMVGAIVLTHRVRPGVRRQKIAEQTARKPGDVLEIQSVSPGSGA